MSRTIEDSEGNFWEIFDDGVVSRNGEPFGELNEYGEIHPYSGSDMYVIDNYGRIVRYSDRAVMGTYRGDNYFDRSTATGGYGGSSGSYGGSSGGGYGSSSGSYGGYSGSSGGGTGCGLLLLLFFGVVGALANLAAVMAGGVMILAEGVRRTGSLRGGLSLIGSEALRAVREALGDLPFADEAMKAVGIVAAALLAALLLAAGVLTLIAMYRILKKGGKPGWHAFVPLLHLYDLFDLACGKGVWFLPACLPVAGVFFLLWLRFRLAGAFGRSALFTAAFLFFPLLCFFVLGVSGAEYQGHKKEVSV